MTDGGAGNIDSQVCAINLGPRGIRTRRLAGTVLLLLGGAAAAGCALLRIGSVGLAIPVILTFVGFPTFIGALCLLQAKEKT